MKKFLIIMAMLSLFSFSFFAQENTDAGGTDGRDESKWSSYSYFNVPILKVLESRDAYIVIYQKNRLGTGSTVIPKAWAAGNPENPRKLKFRNRPKGKTGPFMTVIKDSGEFKRVVLTVPMSKLDPIWGLADYHKKVDGADKDTLEELEL